MDRRRVWNSLATPGALASSGAAATTIFSSRASRSRALKDGDGSFGPAEVAYCGWALGTSRA